MYVSPQFSHIGYSLIFCEYQHADQPHATKKSPLTVGYRLCMDVCKLPVFSPYVFPTVVNILCPIEIELFSSEKPLFRTLGNTSGAYLYTF